MRCGPPMKRSRWRRLKDTLSSRRELARLNHILIPARKADRDKFRDGRFATFIRPWFSGISSLSREGRAVFLLTLLVGFAGLDVGRSQIHLLFGLLTGILLTSLVARSFFRAPSLVVSVAAARRVTVDETQRFAIRLANGGASSLASVRVLTPFLPWDGAWKSVPSGVPVVPAGKTVLLEAEATFMARGEHHVDSFAAALLVPMGLALGPRRASECPRFIVVPAFAAVAHVSVPEVALVNAGLRSPTLASGDADFGGVRPFRSGDSPRHLHARSWARTGVPHVKTFLAERNDRLGVFVLTDGDVAADTKEATLSLAAGVVRWLLDRNVGLRRLLVGRECTPLPEGLGRGTLDLIMDRLGLHMLSDHDVDATVVLDAAEGLSAVVLVACDARPARTALVAELRRRGVSVRAIFVGAEDAGGADEVHVAVGTITRGETIRC